MRMAKLFTEIKDVAPFSLEKQAHNKIFETP